MKVVYGVEWIEIEFGQRDEGWALFLDKDECTKKTKEASARGPYPGGGGYCGPVRPLVAYEIPFAALDKKLQAELRKSGRTHTDNHWTPKFKGARHEIA
jgi:hypothetical protein